MANVASMAKRLVSWLLAGIALVGIVLAWGMTYAPLNHTTFGLATRPGAGDSVIVSAVSAPDAAAGVRVGDRIRYDRLTLSQEMRLWSDGSPIGTPLTLPLERGGVIRNVVVHAQFLRANRADGLFLFCELLDATVTLLVIAYIAARRPTLATAFLVLYGIGQATNTSRVVPQFSWIADPWFGAVGTVIEVLAGALPLVALLPFIARFPHAPDTPGGLLRLRLADGLFLAGIAMFTWRTVDDLISPAWATFDVWSEIVIIVLVLAFTASAYASAIGDERRRVGWVLVGMSLSALGYVAFDVLYVVVHGESFVVLASLANLLQLSLPIALAYAILRHRVLDLGFALNRTAVYALTSVVVFVVLAGLEFVVERYLTALTQTESLAVEFTIALLVIASVRFIHAQTDRFVDTVFFRKRHEDERAIRTFAHEAAFITDEQTLRSRAVETLQAHTGAAFVHIVDDDGNDPAIVSMRAFHKVVDLHSIETSLGGELAYPVVARGRLIGALVMGPKRLQESYAPDESRAIEEAARALGGALDALRREPDLSTDRLVAAISALTAQVAGMQEQLVALHVAPVLPGGEGGSHS